MPDRRACPWRMPPGWSRHMRDGRVGLDVQSVLCQLLLAGPRRCGATIHITVGQGSGVLRGFGAPGPCTTDRSTLHGSIGRSPLHGFRRPVYTHVELSTRWRAAQEVS
jgi:hypothetical protein